MFKHILVPLDGSQQAEQAVATAARLARSMGASLLLLEAVHPLTRFSLYASGVAPYLQQLQEKSLADATTYLSRVAHDLEVEGIETHIEICSGEPAPLILDITQKEEIDLIVLCSHAHTGFSRWALGSTSLKVIRQSTVPVLLLREKTLKPLEKLDHPFRAVVALDGSPFAEAALLPAAHFVAAMNAPGEGEMHFVQLVEVPTIEEEPGYMLDSDFNFQRAALQEAGDYLQAIRARLLQELPKELNLHISWSVEECKDVADALIQIAESGNGISTHKTGDLIVLATHGRSGLQRWILGSVTERALLGSTLPLLVVHPPKPVASPAAEEHEMAPTRHT